MDVVGRPADDFHGGTAGKDGGEDFIFPQVVGSQGVEAESEGEEENGEE